MATDDRKHNIEEAVQKIAGEYFSSHGPTDKLITVTRVGVPEKLHSLTVFVSILPDEDLPETLDKLQTHLPALRKKIGDGVRFRQVPTINIAIDAQEKRRQRIDERLDDL